MSLHGETHSVTVPAEINVTGTAVAAEADLTIPYVSWGLKNPSTFILRVSDKVTMHVKVAGQFAAADPSSF
jgi:hypothetical protein